VDNQRNMILAVILSAIVLFAWTVIGDRYFPTAAPPVTKIEKGKSVALPNPSADPAADSPAAIRDRTVVLNETPRIRIMTPRLQGSINLKGARIDDLTLTTYRETIAKNAPPIRLLSPGGAADSYFAQVGWSGDGVALPGPDTIWTPSGTVLSPGKPVTLSWTNPAGQRFTIRLSVDANYMFTIDQGVANGGSAPVAVRPYTLISRTGHSKDPSSTNIHIGPIGSFNGSTNYGVSYESLDGVAPSFFSHIFGSPADPGPQAYQSTGGWIGYGDKYWLTALVPNQTVPFEANFRLAGEKRYQADVRTAQTVVAPGRNVGTTTRFFAGAKEVTTLDAYKDAGIARFDRAIDWGWFIWFEKPIFYLLDWLFRMVGNFGVAIILLTCIVRGLMFPVAQKQFKSMAGMRVVQPKMKALQEKYKDDKPRLQQEMLKLYQEEKVNPLAGCLPIFLQAPIFYALYKVLMLTIEMRHQPFVLWLKDLSAPDPLTPVNLFGLLPFTPPGFLHLGVLAILLGITMYLQFKLNPTPMDETQKQVFAIMPWVFMFIMAGFAAGLQLYWVVSNCLTIAQQKWLYSRHPVLSEKPAG
jgi:YidC/Oxa1 family membrane protein insertase